MSYASRQKTTRPGRARRRDSGEKNAGAGRRGRLENQTAGLPAAIQALQSSHGNKYVLSCLNDLRQATGCERNIPGAAVQGILAQKGSGRSLDRASRSGLEGYFGRDFSQVRVHTDAFAGQTAHDLRAEAFTIGHDVFFNAGRYNPQTTRGQQLMAHELAHVTQQTTGPSGRKVQCWSYGAGGVAGFPEFLPAPANHRPRVNAAMRIIEGQVNKPRCEDYFTNNTPTGETAQQILNRVRVWELATEGDLGLALVGGSDIAYDGLMYRMGKWSIASTLLHEMMHAGGQVDERTCEMAPDQCNVFTPFTLSGMSPASGRPGAVVAITGALSVGPSQGPHDKIMFGTVDAGRALSWVYSHAGGTRIRVRVPAGLAPGEVDVVIINNNVRSSPEKFTVLP